MISIRKDFLFSAFRKDFLECLSYVVVIFGIPLFFYQQAEQREALRVSNTLEYIRLFQSERLSDARGALLAPWFDHSDAIRAVNASGGMSPSVFNHYIFSMIDKSVEADAENNMRHSLVVMDDFFSQLLTCITSMSCDEESAKTYFRAYAGQIRELYGAWFDKNAKTLNMPEFGSSITKISQM